MSRMRPPESSFNILGRMMFIRPATAPMITILGAFSSRQVTARSVDGKERQGKELSWLIFMPCYLTRQRCIY